MNAFWDFTCWFFRRILALRYRVELKGFDEISSKQFERPGGVLFLPNHPAHMDPLFVILYVWPRFRIRPLVVEYIYRMPVMRPFMKLLGALAIPSFETSVNQIKIRNAEKVLDRIVEGLRKKENFLLYPSGKLKHHGEEMLGGASAAHDVLSNCPDANVVLIRTTGLWGSSFSRALTGRSPDLMGNVFRGIVYALKNFIFFMPRRRVLIEFEADPKGLPRNSPRLQLNRFLENWYNRYPDPQGKIHSSEPISLVPYVFWSDVVPEVYHPKKHRLDAGNGFAVSSETRSKIYAEILRIVERSDLEIQPEMHLAVDLGMDSLQIAELIAYVGQHYEVQELHPEDLETVLSILEVAEGARIAERSVNQIVHVGWPKEKKRPSPMMPLGRTVPEALFNCCDRMGSFAACGDDLVGVLSYKKLKRSVLVLTEEFRKMPEERIGVLLPASAAAYLVIFAIQCAGKVPVMLNWTLGSRYLDEMIKTAEVGPVISSWRFLERLSHVDFGSLVDRVLLLEDIRQNLSLKSKLRGVFYSLLGAQGVLRALKLVDLDPARPAVILFTSGSEATPKGVPLSHKNILFNQRSGMQCIDLDSSDVLYGILPPFHSFGFSVTGLFPLLGGLKVAFYPDPTDSFALAEGIGRWKITLFCSAPSFLKGLFQAAKKDQLASVRLFITGAEKTPAEIYQKVESLGKGVKLIEGYGITECAPILALNRPNLPPKGVGPLLPDIEFCTIHPETHQLLPDRVEGEICVRGPNVFSGYLGNVRSPFIDIDGKKWYRTGDIGYLDEHGNLILSGRLKRFTKLGGEMISLGAIEEAVNKELTNQQRIAADAPAIAICADEKVLGKPQLVLFTTLAIEKELVNDILRRAGFSRLVKISSVRQVPEIPLMGTGKTDYRRLQAMVK